MKMYKMIVWLFSWNSEGEMQMALGIDEDAALRTGEATATYTLILLASL